MRLRACLTLFLAASVAALPTVVSLCELRCVSPGAVHAPSEETSFTCSGHGTGEAGEATPNIPPDSSHDCGEHALLAKGGGVVFQPHLARNLVAAAVVSTPPGFLDNASGHAGTLSISTDLSPPFGRRPGILRL